MNKEYLSDGTVEVTVRMNLSGRMSQTIMPKAFDRQPASEPPPPPPAVSAPAGEILTGLVIDARGLAARPAMSPKVVDQNGREVYGSMNVDRQYAIQQGMTGYARDLTAAQSNPRVTNNPVSVKGVKADGPGKCDIVISNADAERIRASADNLSFLKKGRDLTAAQSNPRVTNNPVSVKGVKADGLFVARGLLSTPFSRA